MKKTIKTIFFVITFIAIFEKIYALENEILKKGNINAKVTVKVFSSLTCPFCADFHTKIYKKLEREFVQNNVVKFEHHAFPLDLAALNAEKIIRCGNSIDSKFKLLDEIYKKQNEWAVGSDINEINNSLLKIGMSLNLDKNKLENCLIDDSLQDKILNQRIDAQKKYKIESTPTIFINEKKYEGKFDFDSIKKYIEKI